MFVLRCKKTTVTERDNIKKGIAGYQTRVTHVRGGNTDHNTTTTWLMSLLIQWFCCVASIICMSYVKLVLLMVL
jgi:hypothetical protein